MDQQFLPADGTLRVTAASLTIRPATGAEAIGAFAGWEDDLSRAVVAISRDIRLGLRGGQAVAVAGIVRIDDGRLFLFFDVADGGLSGSRDALAIVRAARDMLEAQVEPVWTPCHVGKYPTAPKLVALCGFHPTNEIIEDAQVWLRLP